MKCPHCETEMLETDPIYTIDHTGPIRHAIYLCPDCAYTEPRTEPHQPGAPVRVGSRPQTASLSYPCPVCGRSMVLRQTVWHCADDGCGHAEPDDPPPWPPVSHEFKINTRVLDNSCFEIEEHNPFGEITRLIVNTREEHARKALMELGWRPPAKSLKALGITVGASGSDYHCRRITMTDADYYEPEELEAIAAAERLRRTKEED